MSKILDNFNDINEIKKMSIEELNVFQKKLESF